MTEKTVVVLDGAAVTDVDGLHRYLAEQMALPHYYGANLDALYDVLTEIAAETEIALKNSGLFTERLGRYGRQFLRVLRDAAEDNGYLTLRSDSE